MTAPARPAPARPVSITLWVLQAALAAMYLMSAAPKLLADPQAVTAFAALGFGPTGMAVIGALEVLGAVALLVPRLCGAAALGFVGLMTGAVIITVVAVGAAAAVLPAVLLVLAAVVAYGRRDRTAALVAALTRRPA